MIKGIIGGGTDMKKDTLEFDKALLDKLEEDRKKPANAKKYFWTDYEKAQLRSLKHRGYRNKEIAERLGKTLSSVKHMVVKLNACKKAV